MKTQTKSVFSDIIQVLQVELAKLELIFNFSRVHYYKYTREGGLWDYSSMGVD